MILNKKYSRRFAIFSLMTSLFFSSTRGFSEIFSFDSIPFELKNQIASFLGLSDLLNLALVSKSCKAVAYKQIEDTLLSQVLELDSPKISKLRPDPKQFSQSIADAKEWFVYFNKHLSGKNDAEVRKNFLEARKFIDQGTFPSEDIEAFLQNTLLVGFLLEEIQRNDLSTFKDIIQNQLEMDYSKAFLAFVMARYIVNYSFANNVAKKAATGAIMKLAKKNFEEEATIELDANVLGKYLDNSAEVTTVANLQTDWTQAINYLLVAFIGSKLTSKLVRVIPTVDQNMVHSVFNAIQPLVLDALENLKTRKEASEKEQAIFFNNTQRPILIQFKEARIENVLQANLKVAKTTANPVAQILMLRWLLKNNSEPLRAAFNKVYAMIKDSTSLAEIQNEIKFNLSILKNQFELDFFSCYPKVLEICIEAEKTQPQTKTDEMLVE